jgi:hypothetical protein
MLRAASHSDPVRASMDAYAGQALPKKLGIKTGMRIALVNAPPGRACCSPAESGSLTFILSIALPSLFLPHAIIQPAYAKKFQ